MERRSAEGLQNLKERRWPIGLLPPAPRGGDLRLNPAEKQIRVE
jgi:hypothetical protein